MVTRDGGKRRQRRWSGNDGCGGGRRLQRTTMVTVDNDSGGLQWWRTTRACKIGWQTRMGKDKCGRQKTVETMEWQ